MIEINPNGLYSEQDVTLLLGIGPSTQATERRSGKLKATQRGAAYVYKGSDLQAWLDPAMLATPSDKSRSKAGPMSQQFFAAVDAKMIGGMSRPDAVSRVVKEQPALHQAMLAEANQRPARR